MHLRVKFQQIKLLVFLMDRAVTMSLTSSELVTSPLMAVIIPAVMIQPFILTIIALIKQKIALTEQQITNNAITTLIVIAHIPAMILSKPMKLLLIIAQTVQVIQIVRIQQLKMIRKCVTMLPRVKLLPMKQLVILTDRAAIL